MCEIKPIPLNRIEELEIILVQRVKNGENIEDTIRAITTIRENIAYANRIHGIIAKQNLHQYKRNAIGFLAWLQQKSEKLGNTFEVRLCGMQSFSGKKSTKEEIITWVTELVQIEQVEWVDEEKKSFRLLNH